MSKRVEIIFGKDGSIRREAFGFKGPDCFEATEWIDELFGEPDHVEKKASFNEVSEKATKNGLPSGWCG